MCRPSARGVAPHGDLRAGRCGAGGALTGAAAGTVYTAAATDGSSFVQLLPLRTRLKYGTLGGAPPHRVPRRDSNKNMSRERRSGVSRSAKLASRRPRPSPGLETCRHPNRGNSRRDMFVPAAIDGNLDADHAEHPHANTSSIIVTTVGRHGFIIAITDGFSHVLHSRNNAKFCSAPA